MGDRCGMRRFLRSVFSGGGEGLGKRRSRGKHSFCLIRFLCVDGKNDLGQGNLQARCKVVELGQARVPRVRQYSVVGCNGQVGIPRNSSV